MISATSAPEPGPDSTFWVCTETTYDFVSAPPDPIFVKRAGGSIVWFDGSLGMDFIYGTTQSRVPFVRRWTSKFPSAIQTTPTNADVCGFWGDTYISDTPNEYLNLGMDKDTREIYMSHGPDQTLRAPLGNNYNWYLYTFRFSHAEGMSIYENDRLIGSDPSFTSPVRVAQGAGRAGGAHPASTTKTRSPTSYVYGRLLLATVVG
ncbi:MAG: hypothetical protein GY838_05190 [bacterium]|nr:hypothetical protein [bacterium]